MKKVFKSFIFSLSLLGLSQTSIGQCTVSITPSTANIICGESIDIGATGLSATPALATTFDGDSIGAGWVTSAILLYNNPCGPSLDGSSSAWFGNVPLPRTLTTNGFDVSCGGQVCFDLDFGGDDPGSIDDCEDPDLPDEGVYFQYSIDGGTVWTDIFYFQPNSTTSGPYYSWANYCFTLPPDAWTTSTMFQWTQPVATSTVYDHWGIDNVIITPSDCGYYYDWDNLGGSPDPQDQTVTPVTTTTYIVDYTNGIDDTCSTSITVNVEPFDVLAVATLSNINCGDCVDLNSVLNNPPAMTSPNYTYSWDPTTNLSDPNSQGTNACPTDDITYTVTITETTSGCSGTDDVTITVAGGGAVADFAIFPGNQGCAPFAVDFTNNSTGLTYEWDFGDGSPIETTTNPAHIFTSTGTFQVMLVAYLPGAGCINYDTAYVTINVGSSIVPVPDFSYEGECGTTVINVQNTGTAGLVYTWDMGDGTNYSGPNATHDYGATGTYSVTLTAEDTVCGTMESITIDIDVVDNPITYIFNSPSCYLFTDGSISVNTGNNTGSEVFIIADSTGTPVNVGGSNAANNLGGGWYYLDVDLGGGCVAIDSVELINPDELVPSLSIYDVPCNGDATGIAVVDTVYGWQGDYGQLSYNWNPNPASIGGLGADSSYTMPAGNYVLFLTDDNGCSNTYDFTINEPPVLEFTEIGVDPAYCRLFDYQIGHGVVYAAAGGGTPDYDYEWYNLQDSTATGNTTWGGLNPGDYRITVVDGNGCVLVQILTVEEMDPIADFTMTSPEFTVDYEGTAPVNVHFENQSQYYANPNNPNADTTFFWNFDYDNTSWLVSHDVNEEFDTTYTTGGTYTVCLIATNFNDCKDTLCKDIIVYDVGEFTPINVFTPNDDAVNDVFTFVFKSKAIKSFSCVIVDRWGVVMTEFDDITDTWDGTDKSGDKCKDGTYFYTYQGEEENGTPFEGQGTITLISGQ